MHVQYAMVFVRDMGRATSFYRDVVGLPLRFESPEWTEFGTEGATLALHATDVPGPPREHGQTPAGTVRVGFRVGDLDAFHARMLEHGVPCLAEPKELHGTRLAEYAAPDGETFSVSGPRG